MTQPTPFSRGARVALALLLVFSALPTRGQRPANQELRDLIAAGPMQFAIPDTVAAAKSVLEEGNDKIDPQIRELLSGSASKSLDELTSDAKELSIPFEENRVAVTLMADDGASLNALRQRVRDAGGEVTGTLGNAVYALLPMSEVQNVGGAAELHYMMRQATYQPAGGFAQQNEGRVITEGVEVVRARLLHERGITGKGVKIGIIDFGFQKYGALQERGLVPRPVEARPFNQQNQMEVDTVHGTACAEIIHAMAPDAQLYLAAVNGREDQIIQAAQWMVSQGVHVISFSGGGQLGPHNGRALLDLLVQQTVQRGVFWVNAAGNDGSNHWTGLARDANGDGFLDIDSNGANFIAFKTRAAGTQMLIQWDDWGADPTRPTPTQDIDAFLFAYDPQSRETKLVARSVNPQRGRGAPIEAIGGKTPAGAIFLLALKATNVTRPVRVHVYSQAGEEMYPLVAAGSVAIPATSSFALAVGAVDVRNDQLENFSSQGPTDDGRLKPEVSAPDHNRSASYDDTPARGRFPGTSAACPHTSGLAALLRQMNASANPQQLRGLVMAAVRPKGNPVPNNLFGHGHIDASRIQGGGGTPPPRRSGVVGLPGAWGGEIPASAFDRLVSQGRPAGLQLQVATAKDVYQVGDGMKIAYKAGQDCHCLVMHRDSAGKYTLVAPSNQESIRVDAGEKYSLPTGRDVIRVTGPAGREEVILVCARQPEDLRNWGGGDGISVATARYDVKE